MNPKKYKLPAHTLLGGITMGVFALLAAACAKEPQPEFVSRLDYGYFPLVPGAFKEYKVDSIFHDQPSPDIPGVHDTLHYELREVCDTFVTDGQGEEAMRILRLKRTADTLPWVQYDVWTAKLTPQNAQRVEENNRYVKMGFPVTIVNQWDGNALNDTETWEYSYDSIGVARQVGQQFYDRTVRVDQRDYKNLVDDQYAYEIYAFDIGMVYRYHRNLTTQVNYVNNPVAENIRQGVEYRIELTDHGTQ